MDSKSTDPLLEIQNLSTSFHTDENVVRSVRNINLCLYPGETLALVGESGCGKSVTALSTMRLIPIPPGTFENGRILYKGKDLLQISEKEMQKIRGNEISMVFQEPMTSLNPIFTIGDQICETILLHQNKTEEEARELTLEILKKVAIPSPEQRINQYPHELSGGMKQRVGLARAFCINPKVLLLDEPTAGMSSAETKRMLSIIDSLPLTLAILIVEHDMDVVFQVSHWMTVLDEGTVLFEGTPDEVRKSKVVRSKYLREF